MPLISVHLPKTAGVSLRTVLAENFGAGLKLDYQDGPLNKDPWLRKQAVMQDALALAERDVAAQTCIHGHFLPLKYLLLAHKTPCQFVTWMRHPVERLISHYHYWLQVYQPTSAFALHKQVVEEGWTLERFCLSQEMRNTYSQFLWGFPLEYFEFIGITEFYDSDLADFGQRFLRIQPQVHKLNVGAKKAGASPLDPGLYREIQAWHAQDMQLYERALALRQTRLAVVPATL
jgi:hypothetical protein